MSAFIFTGLSLFGIAFSGRNGRHLGTTQNDAMGPTRLTTVLYLSTINLTTLSYLDTLISSLSIHLLLKYHHSQSLPRFYTHTRISGHISFTAMA